MTGGAPMSGDDGAPLPAAAVSGRDRPLVSQWFGATEVTALRHAVARQAGAAGLAGDRLDDFVLAVNELATNAVRHGGGRGHLTLWRDRDSLICDVRDNGAGLTEPAAMVRPPARDRPGGRGLFLADQLADGLLLSNQVDGFTATVVVCVEDRPAGAWVLPGAGNRRESG